jgi:hypothetical protein
MGAAEVTSFADCIRCLGTGRYEGAEPRPCSLCEGLGMIEEPDGYDEEEGFDLYDDEPESSPPIGPARIP